jgi:hypothetical protein
MLFLTEFKHFPRSQGVGSTLCSLAMLRSSFQRICRLGHALFVLVVHFLFRSLDALANMLGNL